MVGMGPFMPLCRLDGAECGLSYKCMERRQERTLVRSSAVKNTFLQGTVYECVKTFMCRLKMVEIGHRFGWTMLNVSLSHKFMERRQGRALVRSSAVKNTFPQGMV